MQKLREWFASLQQRERIAVSIAAVLVAAMLIYVLGLAPLYRAVNTLEQSATARREDLNWMTQNSGSVQALAAAQPQPVDTGESLVLLVDRTAREAGLSASLTNQTPTGANSIQVTLQDAAFDMLMTWLNNLQVSQRIDIQSARINRATQPGLVNVSLELNRAGG